MDQTPSIGKFCWNELATSNIQVAKEFYGKVFGWQFEEHPMGDTTYTMIKLNNQEFAGIWAIPKNKEKEIPPHWMAYILVNEIADSLEKAKKNGAIIIKDITEVGEFGKMAIIRDPTGAHIALWQTLKTS